MNKETLQAAFMQIKNTVVILVWATVVFAQPEISDGTVALPNRIEANGSCTMTDLGLEFINDRSAVCAPGQTGFFNGERRAVRSGVPPYFMTDADTQLGYEITSCACSSNGVWTRSMEVAQSDISSYIEWNWRFFGRRSDCTLELKRNLTKLGCPLRACGAEFVYCPEGYAPGPNCKCVPLSPIIIDLDGNGIKLTSRADGTRFDLNGNGDKGLLPWLEYGSQDGWLVFNFNEDEVILNGRQLFGDKSAQASERFPGESRNGYRALRGFDDNKDGFITPADGVWRLLAVWKDPNHNGISDPGEVTGLAANGITSISLDYKESGRKDKFGNQFRFRAKVIKDGKEHYSYDVFLTAQ
ncbi:MAG: hypothetical protein ACREBC_04935 [Pyrinomonadaceae bacterium]